MISSDSHFLEYQYDAAAGAFPVGSNLLSLEGWSGDGVEGCRSNGAELGKG